MKESKYSPDTRVIMREPFESEDYTRSIKGTPFNITYQNGVAILNGSSSYLTYLVVRNGVYSVRIKLTALAPSGTQYILDYRANSGTGYIRLNGTTVEVSSGTVYVDGVAGTTVSTNTKEITISGITLVASLVYKGRINSSSANFLNASLELVESFKAILTSSEIKNLYENKAYKPFQSSLPLILSVDALSGSIKNRLSSGVVNGVAVPQIVNTNVQVVRSGQIWSARFLSNGILNCDSYHNLLGDLTIISFMKASSFGTSNVGKIIDNSKLKIGVNLTNAVINCTSDGSTTVTSASSVVKLGQWMFVAITRKSDGKASFYINSVLSGSADLNSGTPVAGSTIYIGTTASSNYFDGELPITQVFSGILSVQELSQIWTSTKNKIGL